MLQALTRGDMWACAVENAVGGLLNAFIVTNVRDSHMLRSCAKRARYDNLRIIIYDFSVPRFLIEYYFSRQCGFIVDAFLYSGFNFVT